MRRALGLFLLPLLFAGCAVGPDYSRPDIAKPATFRMAEAAQAEQVEALRSTFQLASLRYKGGLANYLDVLLAQRNLFDAELALTTTHRLQLVSVIQLYKALAGGWHAYSSVSSSTTPEQVQPVKST